MKKARYVLRTFGLAALLRRGFAKARSLAAVPARRTGAAVPPPKGARKILVIDDYVPLYDRSAGGKRMYELLKLMRALDYHVLFVPDEGGAHQPYADALRDLGIDARYKPRRRSRFAEVARLRDLADVAWVSRPALCSAYLATLRARRDLPVIYDTVDLHYRRVNSRSMRELELQLARACDRTVVTTLEEQAALAEYGITSTRVVPVVEPWQHGGSTGYGQRRDLLFIGNYTHEPNVDAAVWFCQNVMPLIRQRSPGISLTLAGVDPTPRIRSLGAADITVTGYIPDLAPLHERHRVFVAPLRFGAGIKGKIVEALGRALPVVTTPAGAEGIGLTPGFDALVAQNAEDFAQSILRVYHDPELWLRLSQNAVVAARRFSPDAVMFALRDALTFEEPAAAS